MKEPIIPERYIISVTLPKARGRGIRTKGIGKG